MKIELNEMDIKALKEILEISLKAAGGQMIHNYNYFNEKLDKALETVKDKAPSKAVKDKEDKKPKG